MNLFSHPRSVKFTSHFHGFMYENGSLENYSRVVERTAQRARLLEDKLEKLRAREQYLLEDDAKRKERRIQREAARQRRVWQMHQVTKRADERARESAAAVTVQKVVRGSLARRATRMLRQVSRTNDAASMLQRAMKMYVARQQLASERERRAREEEEKHEREMHSAAAVLQRQARKRLKVVQEARKPELVALVEDEENEEEDEKEEETDSPDQRPLSADEKITTEALSRGISLDILFSDEEGSENEPPTDSTSTATLESVPDSQLIVPQPPPQAARRPRRPMSIKRVGGGYRTKFLPVNSECSPPQDISFHSAAKHTHRGRTMRGVEPTASEEFLNHSRLSPPIPKAALSPTLVALPISQQRTRSTIAIRKCDGDELRAASPTKASGSPYAIPQRLPPSR
ncbi:hypothetical protein P3T76_003421 [Phytophthora citrophthora]|uniref:Uncharacterized protein n=1 Tax=Phytophthora citrophthora TaxID=4793 RepID=A0AAD9LPG4_9STRA|nr:hypothetical protein P3T76_003421 [Phytophthora citrophthora]